MAQPDVANAPRNGEDSRRSRRVGARSGDPRKRDHKKKLARDVRGSTTPRVWTPPLRELTPDVLDAAGNVVSPATSLGFDVVEWARESLLVDLLPWQEWLLIHALELLPNGALRFRNVVVLVARQNGKSTLSQVLSLYFLCVMGRRTVLTTAQDLDTAEEIWQGAVDLMQETDEEDRPVRPDVFGLVRHVSMVNGKKALILTTGERYKVKAANRKAGRGLTGDLVILDELREHQTWDAWGAITKTTQARPDAQVWCLSNAGDVTSVVLRHLRLKAHRAIGDPDGIAAAEDVEASAPTVEDEASASEAMRVSALEHFDWIDTPNPEWDFSEDGDGNSLEVDASTLGLFEWSAHPGAGLMDVDEWALGNPAMNYRRGDTSITTRSLKASAEDDPEWVFRTENMCQWPDGALAGLFEAGKWEARRNVPLVLPSGVEVVRQRDKIVGGSWLCIDQSQDGSWSYVGRVGRSSDGRWQGEVVAARRGTDWLGPWLLVRAEQVESVCAQGRGAPISGWLNDAEKDPKLARLRFVRWEGADLIPGHAAGFEAVRDGLLWHNKQPVLDTAAERSVAHELGGGPVIDRLKSSCDAAPLIALFGAWWLSQRPSRAKAAPPAPMVVTSGASGGADLPDFLRIEPMGVI